MGPEVWDAQGRRLRTPRGASCSPAGLRGRRGPSPGRSLRNQMFVLLRTALKDRPKGPPTANHYQPPPTTNPQPPTAANHHQPPPTASCQLPTANRRQPPTANRHQPWLSTWSARRLFCGKLYNGTLFFPPLRTALPLPFKRRGLGLGPSSVAPAHFSEGPRPPLPRAVHRPPPSVRPPDRLAKAPGAVHPPTPPHAPRPCHCQSTAPRVSQGI